MKRKIPKHQQTSNLANPTNPYNINIDDVIHFLKSQNKNYHGFFAPLQQGIDFDNPSEVVSFIPGTYGSSTAPQTSYNVYGNAFTPSVELEKAKKFYATAYNKPNASKYALQNQLAARRDAVMQVLNNLKANNPNATSADIINAITNIQTNSPLSYKVTKDPVTGAQLITAPAYLGNKHRDYVIGMIASANKNQPTVTDESTGYRIITTDPRPVNLEDLMYFGVNYNDNNKAATAYIPFNAKNAARMKRLDLKVAARKAQNKEMFKKDPNYVDTELDKISEEFEDAYGNKIVVKGTDAVLKPNRGLYSPETKKYLFDDSAIIGNKNMSWSFSTDLSSYLKDKNFNLDSLINMPDEDLYEYIINKGDKNPTSFDSFIRAMNAAQEELEKNKKYQVASKDVETFDLTDYGTPGTELGFVDEQGNKHLFPKDRRYLKGVPIRTYGVPIKDTENITQTTKVVQPSSPYTYTMSGFNIIDIPTMKAMGFKDGGRFTFRKKNSKHIG